MKNDERYAEYTDSVSDEDLEGGIYIDATLDYIEKRGEARGERKDAELEVKLYSLLTADGKLREWGEAITDMRY